MSAMIEARGLTKRYGDKLAVDDLSFTVTPGRVTGFLGPNGAGKSTTMQMILGLVRPTSGTVTVNGASYASAPAPARAVGALLDAKGVHRGRTAFSHLLALAAAARLPRRRVDEVLELVGLAAVAHKRAGGMSLGMGQRLGIATALLGDPDVLILDEPVNGLDPEGILWIRSLMRSLAAEGRTVFLSSHLMSEMQDTADHLIVIGRGQLVADTSMAAFLAGSSHSGVLVRTPHAADLVPVLLHAGGSVSQEETSGPITVRGLSAEEIGSLAGRHGLWLYELATQRASLEAAFMELTGDAVEYRTPAATGKAA
jgi:ABC-2 type transport system ATP-binding protein